MAAPVWMTRGPDPQVRIGANYFFMFSAFAIVAPYLQLLLRTRGFDSQQIGFLQGTVDAVGIASPILWGWISDHAHRRRRQILAGLALGAGAAFFAVGHVSSFWGAMMAVGALGFCLRPIIPLTDGLVLRYLAMHGGDYGRPRVWGSVAFVLTTLSLERLGAADPVHGARVVLAAMCVVAVAGAMSGLALPDVRPDAVRTAAPETGHEDGHEAAPPPIRAILGSRQFLVFLAVAFLSCFGMAGYYGFFSLYVKEDIGYAKAGNIWMLGPLCEMPMLFFSWWFLQRLGVRRLLLIAIASVVVRLGGYALAPNLLVVILLQPLHIFTFAAYHVSSLTFINRLVPSAMKQRATTIFAVCSGGMAAIVGNVVGGVLIKHANYRVMYGTFAAVAAVGLVIGLIWLVDPVKERPKEISS